MRLDHEVIAKHRERGDTWAGIAHAIGYTGNPDTLRRVHSRWRQRHPDFDPVAHAVARSMRGEIACSCEEVGGACDTCTPLARGQSQSPTVSAGSGAVGQANPRAEGNDIIAETVVTADELARITSLDDLIRFFKVDTDVWAVKSYEVTKWEQASGNKKTGIAITPLYRVKATLVRSFEAEVETLAWLHEQCIADMQAHAPVYDLPVVSGFTLSDDPCLLELGIHDPHFGMLAWGKEVGQPYDSDIAVRDYAAAVEHLLGVSRFYPIERILYIVGHDLLHVDAPGVNARGGTTAAGTPQDVDSRLARMFTYARRAVVEGIDRARLIAPVDVVVVPGNHDRETMYKMGEVLNAWYRNDKNVNVTYGPNKRKFYGYGRNAFMLTHGEEYRRKRDSLPLIFATECPADLWVASEGGCREIHTGHNHITLRGGYFPTAEVDETRAIRTRSLPALTTSDSWHYEEGYKHQRAATALVYRKSGGLAGEHQFTL